MKKRKYNSESDVSCPISLGTVPLRELKPKFLKKKKEKKVKKKKSEKKIKKKLLQSLNIWEESNFSGNCTCQIIRHYRAIEILNQKENNKKS